MGKAKVRGSSRGRKARPAQRPPATRATETDRNPPSSGLTQRGKQAIAVKSDPASSVERHAARRAPEPPPKYATEWDAEQGCVVDTVTRQKVVPVEPVRHAMPEGTPTRLVREGLVPALPSFTQYVCDVRWREAGCPKIGSPEREEVFRGCATDFRIDAKERRCWSCPYWTFHPEETPL